MSTIWRTGGNEPMNKRDQSRLVRDLCNGLKREMLARLPSVPKEGDEVVLDLERVLDQARG